MLLPHEARFRLRLPALVASVVGGLGLAGANAPGETFPVLYVSISVALISGFFGLVCWCLFGLLRNATGGGAAGRGVLTLCFYFYSVGAVATLLLGPVLTFGRDEWFAAGLMLPVGFSVSAASYLQLAKVNDAV